MASESDNDWDDQLSGLSHEDVIDICRQQREQIKTLQAQERDRARALVFEQEENRKLKDSTTAEFEHMKAENREFWMILMYIQGLSKRHNDGTPTTQGNDPLVSWLDEDDKSTPGPWWEWLERTLDGSTSQSQPPSGGDTEMGDNLQSQKTATSPLHAASIPAP